MLRAWYLDDSTVNDRKPHMREPNKFVDLETLKSITGVVYVKVSKKVFSSKIKLLIFHHVNELRWSRCERQKTLFFLEKDRLYLIFSAFLPSLSAQSLINGDTYFNIISNRTADEMLHASILYTMIYFALCIKLFLKGSF